MRFIPFEALPALEDRLRILLAGGDWCERRDALGMSLGLHGFRVREVCLCKAESLEPHAGKITPPQIKRSKLRTVPIHPSLAEAIVLWRAGSARPWLLFTSRGGKIFPSHLQRFCRRVTREVFGYSYRFHALRHTFAMRVYSKTRDLLLVKKLLGHNFVTSTQVYAEAMDELPAELLFSAVIKDISSSSNSSREAVACITADVMQRNTVEIPRLGTAGATRWGVG